MKKNRIALKLDDLRVESFETLPGLSEDGNRLTVHIAGGECYPLCGTGSETVVCCYPTQGNGTGGGCSRTNVNQDT
jgi:hypothetical protein